MKMGKFPHLHFTKNKDLNSEYDNELLKLS